MKRHEPKVVTANALLDGHPVYLTADDRWSRDHAQAELILDEAHGDMRLLFAEAQADRVVSAYLAPARAGPHGPEPAHIREILRTTGPSHHTAGSGGLTPTLRDTRP